MMLFGEERGKGVIKMARGSKPLVTIKMDCPKCQSTLKVEVHRNRLNPAPPAEYSYRTNIEVVKQGELFKRLTKDKKKAS